MSTPAIEIEGLEIAVSASGKRLVGPVSLAVRPGEMLALVGESGSGKTMIGRSVLRLLPPAVRITAGSIRLAGRDVMGLPDAEMRSVRGHEVGMVFQEPMVSLNPSLTIGYQLTEGLRLHEKLSARAARARAVEMLERTGIVDPAAALSSYPHQFSGGMRQRIMIASVLAVRPRLVVADEPTTALDALIRVQMMELITELIRETGTAVLLISHDLPTVATHANQVVVLREGLIVEQGSAADILLSPRDPYTRSLIDSLPTRKETARPSESTPLVEIDRLEVSFRRNRGLLARPSPPVRAVANIDLALRPGETLALVGESGSGKTTVGRALLRLTPVTAGSIRFAGEEVTRLRATRLVRFRRCTEMIFQDPNASLNPRMRIGAAVAEPLRHEPGLDPATRRVRAEQALAEVGLPADYARRYAHELSGGQRQRVCIARAIVGRPELIVADEPVSALDVSVQAQVLDLLAELQQRHGFAMLFISHDLAVVEQIATRVAVMYHGRLLEIAPRDALFDQPQSPYTRRLLAASPRIRHQGEGYALFDEISSPSVPPVDFLWYDPTSGDAARNGPEPTLVEIAPGHRVACIAR